MPIQSPLATRGQLHRAEGDGERQEYVGLCRVGCALASRAWHGQCGSGSEMSHLEISDVFVCLGQAHNLMRSSRGALLIVTDRWAAAAVHRRRFSNLAHEYRGCVRHHQGEEDHRIRHRGDDRYVHGQGLECSGQHAVQPFVSEPEVQ